MSTLPPESADMNNACPSCGAIYAVFPKDIGRKIKCKKCATALRVDDSGLVVDDPGGPLPSTADDSDRDDSGTGKKKVRVSGGGLGLGISLERIGGVPTLLFGLGTFLVLYFFFQSTLMLGSVSRADGGLERVNLELEQKLRKYRYEEVKLEDDLASKALQFDDYQKRIEDLKKEKKRLTRDYDPKLDEAKDNKTDASISAKRWAWFDTFGLMSGFILLAFGCIAYVRSDAHLLVRIVGGTILVVMMMAVFAKFSGCGR